MHFMIVDSAGNAIEAFTDNSKAVDALQRVVAEDPAAAREVALLSFDDDGLAVGEPVVAADVAPEWATSVWLIGAEWVRKNAETFVSSAFNLSGQELRPNGVAALSQPA